MRRMSLFVCLCFLLPIYAWSVSDNKAKQIADINFENGTVSDNLGNVIAETLNGASVISDDIRQGKVLSFDADLKGCLQLKGDILSDEMTISFFGKREDIDPNANWRMFLALYADDGSNIYLTPKTTWGNDSYIVIDNKPYSTYRSIAREPLGNNQWYHFALVFKGIQVKYYVNGKLSGELETLLNLSDFNISKIFLGCNPETSYSMSGRIDNIKIYHTALAVNQIAALAEDKELPEPSVSEDGEIAYARFSFETGLEDDMKNIESSSLNVERTKNNVRGYVADIKSDSRMSLQIGDLMKEELSFSFVYFKDLFKEEDVGKVLVRFQGQNNDEALLLVSQITSGQAVFEFKIREDGIVRTTGKMATIPLYSGKWNSISLVQVFSAGGSPYYRIYLNGALGKQIAGYTNKENPFSQIDFGCGENTCTGLLDEITLERSSLTSDEIRDWDAEFCDFSEFTVCVDQKKQTIRNFGASDGWSTQFIGKYFPENKKEHLAELLFSCDTLSNGTPKGIGLSAWRFNIGAGTSEQGAASRISDETRRTECFLNPDMTTYDWTKQAGQQWFLEKAVKTYNVPDIIGWQNSPPVYYTVRGLGFREYGDAKSTILKREHFNDFGKFLVDVVSHFKEQGINFKYISPLNEPQWEWNATSDGGVVSQEGTPWTNQEVSDVVKAIDAEFVKRGIDTKLFITEAGSINYLLKESTGDYANQLYNFWDDRSELKIKDLLSVSSYVSSHSYWTDASATDIVEKRNALRDQIEETDPELEYWQTEYSLLGNGYKAIHSGGSSRTLSPMECGISLARIIHNDLVEADCSGWQWWTTFEKDASSGNEERFALIRYILNNQQTDGVYRPTKLLYALGNFSRFIRPGMKRVDVMRLDGLSAADAIANQMVSAYIDEINHELVIVVINASTQSRSIRMNISGLSNNMGITHFTPYITTNNLNDALRRGSDIAVTENYTMPATSIVTFVGKIKDLSDTGIIESVSDSRITVYPNPAKDQVTIRSEVPVNKISLIDLNGKIIYSSNPDSEIAVLPLNGLYKGVYVLKLNTGEETEIQKLIVK